MTVTDPVASRPPPRAAVRWWRRPWIGPLMLVAAVFLGVSVPRYLTFDPALSRLEGPPGDPVYHPVLVAHVLFGTVAMVAACFQVWPRFRAGHPWGHRMTGRVYVLGGVLPGGLTALYVGAHTPFGPVVMVGNLSIAVLWLAVTLLGWRAARGRRFTDHRVWMLRSFALTMSIVLSRVLGGLAILALVPWLETGFGGDEDLLVQSATAIGVWLSALLSLGLAEAGIRRWGRRPGRSGDPGAARPERRPGRPRPEPDRPPAV
ncbi:DUF2306 domain-containing protein [Nocardiopsis sp. CC223A]|uniref:DUF2306 domain-containing protein n=1 Tax=Nocardiopsis sp. CC223A TaxID=3044051 RepID=UPI00278C6700|nr:DUF2306 domain-containing protein [Nocardiopsis sp. CC223A]